MAQEQTIATNDAGLATLDENRNVIIRLSMESIGNAEQAKPFIELLQTVLGHLKETNNQQADVILDLRNKKFMFRTAMREMINLHDELVAFSGKKLQVTQVTPEMQKALSGPGLDNIFDIHTAPPKGLSNALAKSRDAKPDTQLGNSGATIIPPNNVHEYMHVV